MVSEPDDLPFSKSRQLARVQKNGHVWGCGCPPCLGRRNRRKGQIKQRAAAKALGVPPAKFASQLAHEEHWRGEFRVEVKSGQQVKALTTRFLAAEKQSEQNRAIGDNREFMFVSMADGMGDGLVTMRMSVWRDREANR